MGFFYVLVLFLGLAVVLLYTGLKELKDGRRPWLGLAIIAVAAVVLGWFVESSRS